MRRTIALAVMLALAGCGSPNTGEVPIITTHETEVAITTTCTPNIGPEPQYADAPSAIAAAANVYERVKLILAGRLQRIARDKEKSAALEACGTPAK